MAFGWVVVNALVSKKRQLYLSSCIILETKEDGQPYTFKELKEELIPYLVEMNYTHVEFMPLMAHPLGMSWGSNYGLLCF